MLPAVRAAVGPDVEIIVDGGIQRTSGVTSRIQPLEFERVVVGVEARVTIDGVFWRAEGTATAF